MAIQPPHFRQKRSRAACFVPAQKTVSRKEKHTSHIAHYLKEKNKRNSNSINSRNWQLFQSAHVYALAIWHAFTFFLSFFFFIIIIITCTMVHAFVCVCARVPFISAASIFVHTKCNIFLICCACNMHAHSLTHSFGFAHLCLLPKRKVPKQNKIEEEKENRKKRARMLRNWNKAMKWKVNLLPWFIFDFNLKCAHKHCILCEYVHEHCAHTLWVIWTTMLSLNRKVASVSAETRKNRVNHFLEVYFIETPNKLPV